MDWPYLARMSTWREFEFLRPGAGLLVGGYKQDHGEGYLLQRYVANAVMLPFQPGQIKDYFSIETGLDGGLPGKCFTEWGGPVFFNNRIVGIIPYGASKQCATTSNAYSLNNPRAMSFVYGAIEDPIGLKSRHDFR
jgi:hypothetical protein